MLESEPGEPPRGSEDAVGGVGSWTLGRAVETFFVARAPRKDAKHTTAAYRRDLTILGRHLAESLGVDPDGADELPVDALRGDTLRRAFATFAQTRTRSSIARAWSTWNQLFAFLVAERVLEGNPMAMVERPRVPRPEPKALQGEDTPEKLLRAVQAGLRTARDPWPERDFALVAVALVAGTRSAELLGLTTGSIAGRPGERRLEVVGKGGKPRSVPIGPPIEAALEDYLKTRRARFPNQRLGPHSPLFVDTHGEPLQRGGLQYLVRRSYGAAGIGKQVPKGALVHALRHTAGTRLAEDGASASEIAVLLGHESISTSQGYIDVTTREQRAAALSNRTYRVLDELTGE